MDHKPIQPPRPTFIGECVYASMWEALMTRTVPEQHSGHEDEEPIWDVLGEMDRPITQRHANVVASVVCWLGTNCGNAMLRNAERKRDVDHWHRYDCYLLAWTIENRRSRGVNSGIRVIEYLLAPAETVRKNAVSIDLPLTVLPVLSAEDLEAADQLMRWLAEKDGQAFIRQCEAEIKRLLDEHSLAERARFLRENYVVPVKA